MKAILKLILIILATAIIYNYAPAKQPPADLGYPPPAGWEFVMKLDSVSQFNIYAYNDTCYLTYNDGKGNNSGYKNLFSFDGGETWKTEQELGLKIGSLSNLFLINSTAMFRITDNQTDKNVYYEKSYDIFKTVHESSVITKISNNYGPYKLYQSPIDSNILILTFKYASGLAQIEDDYPFISRDAGRTWSIPTEIWHFGYTLFDFYFDLAQKGHWFANIGDGDNSESHINLGRYAAVNETYDDGLTFQLKQKGVPPYSPDGTPMVGIDGKKTYRTWLGSKDGNFTSYYGIKVTDYSDTIKTSKDYDWLTAMDPTKPKTNIDSGFARNLQTETYQYIYNYFNNIFLPVNEKKGEILKYNFISYDTYIYKSEDFGRNWNLINFTNNKPIIYKTFLDQKTKILWLYAIDQIIIATKPDSWYRYSLWKLKLNWNLTNVREEDIDENFQLYPNPANDKLKIKKSFINKAYSIVVFDLYGNEILNYKNIFATKESDFNIDLPSNLTSGTYFLKVMSENNISVRKFIIIK
ncbi:MAG: hypothetical protein HW421_3518 [Ignavibacteria bacterium]|nr:hypothetical protein [Ignavibacteria bacterium]